MLNIQVCLNFLMWSNEVSGFQVRGVRVLTVLFTVHLLINLFRGALQIKLID